MAEANRSTNISDRFYRLAPRTLRGRLIATTLIVAMVVVASTFAIASAFNSRTLRLRAEAGAQQTLKGFSDFLYAQADEMRFATTQLASRPEIAAAIDTHDAKTLDREIGESLPAGGGFEIVVVDHDGHVVYSRAADKSCIDAVTRVAKTTPGDFSGPLLMSDGPYLVASTSVATSESASPARIIVSRPLGAAGAGAYTDIAGGSMRLAKPGSIPRLSAWQQIAVKGFSSNTRFTVDGADIKVVGTLNGIDGGPVSDVQITQQDASAARSATFAWISILASSIFAGIIGLSVGIVIADLVREPVDSMVGRVKKEGFRAIEGMPYSGVSLDNPRLPDEFRELGAVVDGLLYGLSARQAELKRVTSATQEAEEALAVTVNESADAMVLVQEGLVRIANPATTSHLGVTPRNLLGRTPQEVFDGLDLAREDGSPAHWTDLAAESSETPLLVRNAVAGRGDRWLEIRVVHPPSSLKDRVLFTARDVTDSRRLEQLRAELVSMISHDLRTPLTVIVGYLDLLSTDLPEPARDKAISQARSNAMRMESMLDDLLNATRAEELFAPKVLLPVHLGPLADDVANSIRATAPEHRIEVACDFDGAVLGEEKRLRQALVNLVANAVKYSPPGTRVTIRVSARDGRAFLAVEDSGPGIPDQYRRSVFDRFTRVDNGGGKPGLGLGLYIVRVVTEGHGGRAYVEDGPEGGSRFVMELPVAHRKPARAPAASTD